MRREVIPLLVLTCLPLACAQALAYNPETHRTLVVDAITYIEDHGTPSQKAALDRLVRRAGNVASLRKLLGDEAYNTDHYHDTYFYSNSSTIGWLFGGSDYSAAGHNFTSLHHFVNTQHRGDLWRDRDGYYYQWSSKEGDDHKAMSGDIVSCLDVEVDNEFSLFLQRYKPSFAGTASEWNENWTFHSRSGDDWDIENSRFAPAGAMASYWFGRYMGFPQEPAATGLSFVVTPPSLVQLVVDRRISSVQLLGPALHACGDVTVPHHALGVMGLSHSKYEDWAQDDYDTHNSVRMDPALVRGDLALSFMTIGRVPIPRDLRSIQVTVVTADADGAGTDGDIYLDMGSRSWELDTELDDFERGRDDVFTLDPRGAKIEDLSSLKIRHTGGGSAWTLKAIYVVANGAVIYANDHVNRRLDGGASVTFPDYHVPTPWAKDAWPIDLVLNRAAEYTVDYMKREGGVQDPLSREYWNSAYFRTPNASLRLKCLQHLMNLSIALIVRTIEMTGSPLPGKMMPIESKDIVAINIPSPSQGVRSAGAPRDVQREVTDAGMRRVTGVLEKWAGGSSAVLARTLEAMEDSLGASMSTRMELEPDLVETPTREPKMTLKRLRHSIGGPAWDAGRLPSFRRRSAEEVRSGELSERYFRESMVAERRSTLAHLTMTRAILRAALKKSVSQSEREKLTSALRQCGEARTEILADLGKTPLASDKGGTNRVPVRR